MGKKITLSLVAIVLIVASMVSFNMNGMGSIAHAGNGTDKEIKNVGDLCDVTDAILYSLDGRDNGDSKFKSATVHVNLMLKQDYSYGSTDSAKGSAEVDMTLYLTNKAIYAEMQMISYSSSVGEEKDENGNKETKNLKSFAKYNFNVYISEKKCYVKIMDFNTSSNTASQTINAEYMNKWIEVPHNIAVSYLPSLNIAEQYLEEYIDMLDGLLELEEIKEKDTSLSLNERELAEMLGETIDTDDYTINFEVDLSDKTHSYISMHTAMKTQEDVPSYDSTSGNSSTISYKTSKKEVVDIVIYNVNNTVVDLGSAKIDPVTEVETMDDWKDLFTTKEYKED